MTSRRIFLVVGFAAAVLPARTAGAADADMAAAFVDQMLKELLAVVNGAGTLTAKRTALARIVEQRVDVDAVAKFCLGRFWRTATATQQADYLVLFHGVLVRNVTGKVGEYQGVTYTMGKANKRENDIAVATIVNRPGNAPNKVEWVVGAAGEPRVIDVVAEGTSLRLTQRSDYAAFIARNGNNVQALIDALRQQAAVG